MGVACLAKVTKRDVSNAVEGNERGDTDMEICHRASPFPESFDGSVLGDGNDK